MSKLIQDQVAVLTMVRDDDEFLKKWVDYYGSLFGRASLFVINHGDQDVVRDIAVGCNLFPVPDRDRKKFTMMNWRTKNSLLEALIRWYPTVIVCDVDEFIAVDPATGHDLQSWIAAHGDKSVRTAFGLEVVHLPDEETHGIHPTILGPRQWAQVNLHYAKPCIIGRQTKLSRGGHYSEYDRLDMPDALYLFHMKFCDAPLYAETLSRRRRLIDSMEVKTVEDTTSNVQWFAPNRDDIELFRDYAMRKRVESFDFAEIRAELHETFGPRDHGLFHFQRSRFDDLHRIPERFFGLF